MIHLALTIAAGLFLLWCASVVIGLVALFVGALFDRV